MDDKYKEENNLEGEIKHKKPRRPIKKAMMIIAGILVVGLFFYFSVKVVKEKLFGEKKSAVTEFELINEGVPVKVYKIKRMDFKDTLPALGVIKGYKQVPLKFQISGIMESFNFEEGEKIQEGDIIANLEQKDALLKLKYAELEMENVKKMLKLGGVIEIAVEKAKLEYESARSDLEKTNIYATSDGVLGSHDIDVGTYVTPNDRVGVFANITKVYGEFNIIEKDVPKLKLGQKCEIYVDALPNKNFIGTIDTISPLIEGRTRTQKVRVELKNRDGALHPGMFTRGLISTYEKKNTVIIPASSLKKKEDGYVVFVVHRDEDTAEPADDEEGFTDGDSSRDLGAVEVRSIKVEYMTQDKVEVGEGLEEGELVVMELYQELQDKEKVEIAEVQEILY